MSQEDIALKAWPGANLSNDNVRQQISVLRNKLGRDVILTVPNRGYQLAATVVLRPVRPPDKAPNSSPFRWLHALAVVAICLMAGFFEVGKVHTSQPSALPHWGRLLVRSTSEGRSPDRISLTHLPDHLVVSPDGSRLFSTQTNSRILSIISIATHSVRTILLPQPAGPLALSRGGVLYIGSPVGGLMTVDLTAEQLQPRTMPTGGEVWDLALTPAGDKLFLAMRSAGLKRLMTQTGRFDQITDRTCPESLALDPQGKALYVAYQCSGPGGHPGHDSVEIFDVEKEVSRGIISGSPMVGGHPSTSPDGKLVLLDGLDACWSPGYDHAGCGSPPSRVYHLIRTSDRQTLRSFEFPVTPPFDTYGRILFVDSGSFLVGGRRPSVLDARTYGVLERWDTLPDSLGVFVFSPDGSRLYAGGRESRSILLLERDAEGCSPPTQGLRMSYSADGTSDDPISLVNLTSHGRLQYRPGKVGQAFSFDGSNFLSASWIANYRFDELDWSFSLYLKFEGTDREEMTIVDWSSRNPQRGTRLLKSEDHRIVFQSWPGERVLISEAQLSPGIWYHVAVTHTDQNTVLYINGAPESRVALGRVTVLPGLRTPPLSIGGSSEGAPPFHGLLDEILFYQKALTADEVAALYQLRESGPCRM